MPTEADLYLQRLLAQYQVPTDQNSPARMAASQIAPVIQTWAGSSLNSLEFSGSFAKGTGVLGVTDVDIFVSLKASTSETLKEIFESLFSKAQSAYWNPRKQNVSIGVSVAGAKVDLVPGKVQEGYRNYHSLYKSKSGSWTQTNIKTHIDAVQNSGRVQEIRLAKLWRQRNSLDFPSFYLELAVIQALSGKRQGDLANNFWHVLEYFANNLVAARFIDPANTNNVISEDIGIAEKSRIASAAKVSRSKKNWSEIIW